MVGFSHLCLFTQMGTIYNFIIIDLGVFYGSEKQGHFNGTKIYMVDLSTYGDIIMNGQMVYIYIYKSINGDIY